MINEILLFIIIVLVMIIISIAQMFFKAYKLIDAQDTATAQSIHKLYADIKATEKRIDTLTHEVKLSAEELEILNNESLANQARLNRLEQFCNSLPKNQTRILDLDL